MTALERYQELLEESGVSLASLNLSDIGLTRADALRAVEILREGVTPILGGDLFFLKDGRPEFAFDNWSTEPEPGETNNLYVRRSCDTTEAFVRKIPDQPDVELLFAFVVGMPPKTFALETH
jgi:hypothetical protein